jgi:hypothetical protein
MDRLQHNAVLLFFNPDSHANTISEREPIRTGNSKSRSEESTPMEDDDEAIA